MYHESDDLPIRNNPQKRFVYDSCIRKETRSERRLFVSSSLAKFLSEGHQTLFMAPYVPIHRSYHLYTKENFTFVGWICLNPCILSLQKSGGW